KSMDVTRSKIERPNQLLLILSDGLLIDRIGYVEAVAGQKRIEVESIVGRQLVVKTVEQVHRLPPVVERVKFRRIEKSPGTLDVKLSEVASLISAHGQVAQCSDRAKGPVTSRKTACGLVLPKP